MVVSNRQITDNQGSEAYRIQSSTQVMLLQYKLRGYGVFFFVSFTAVSSALRTVGRP